MTEDESDWKEDYEMPFMQQQAGSEPICSLGVKQLGHHCMDLAPSCPQPSGRWGKRSSPPSLTWFSAIAGRVRWVAWWESPNYGWTWAGGLLVGPLENPWPPRKVTRCTGQCATASPNGRPLCLVRENSYSATWLTAASTERPKMAPGISFAA